MLCLLCPILYYNLDIFLSDNAEAQVPPMARRRAAARRHAGRPRRGREGIPTSQHEDQIQGNYILRIKPSPYFSIFPASHPSPLFSYTSSFPSLLLPSPLFPYATSSLPSPSN